MERKMPIDVSCRQTACYGNILNYPFEYLMVNSVNNLQCARICLNPQIHFVTDSNVRLQKQFSVFNSGVFQLIIKLFFGR